MPAKTTSFRARIFLLGALFLGCAFVLVYRLYTFQWIEHEQYKDKASQAHQRRLEVVPRRGSILDVNGNPLATTIELDAVTLTGKEITRPEAVARTLAPLVGMQPGEIVALIDPEREAPVTLKDQLPAAIADRIRDEIDNGSLNGVRVEPRPVRQYPEGSIAPQVLGFIGRDRDGLSGIEYRFDQELTGEPGIIETEADTHNQEILLARRVVKPVRDGSDLVLTIDRFVQRTLERELAEAIRANKASGGFIIVMEPATGAIRGMASLPTYTVSDPMVFKPGEEMLQKAVAVTNQYEPGSVMKVVTMAGALELGLVTPTTVINDNGIISFPGARGTPPTTIRNWDHRANGPISMTEVLIRSSNVGTYHVAQKLGPTDLYRFLTAFGFGERTGVQLPGEVPGTVRLPTDPDWTVVDLATNAFGQGIAVTPLQMLNAVSTIGNDGKLMRPTIVSEIIGPDGPIVVEPQQVRQVISPTAARTLREMMVAVMEQPALQQHRIPGLHIAGKTGTADMPTDLGYTSGKTFASIAALLPADRPRLAILIRLDAPEAIYGGVVAAPVLKRVGSELAAYYRIPTSADGR